MESVFNLLEQYFVLDYLLWICFFIYCLTFNKKKNHWFNLISAFIICLVLWFVNIENYQPISVILFSIIFLVFYTVLNQKFNLNPYILGCWVTPFIEFIKKPSFKHRKLSLSSSLNLVIYFVFIKIILIYLFIYPLSNLFIELFSIDKHYDNSLDELLREPTYYIFVSIVFYAALEEIQFRAAFRKPNLNVFIYGILVVPPIFNISFYYIIPMLLLYWFYSDRIPKRFYIKYSRWIILISALLFGLIHHNGDVHLFDLLGYIVQVFGGICYLWLRIRFGLSYSIAAHSLSNLLIISIF
ncbi:hypothetical protein A1D29_00655 [Pasteurellaceae bacterium Orientalotternb1]|nr:hypothetical protein A1D29_00655 [Pasteurellaceae bacterium Orientalotternb1]